MGICYIILSTLLFLKYFIIKIAKTIKKIRANINNLEKKKIGLISQRTGEINTGGKSPHKIDKILNSTIKRKEGK